jgi:hypothetical protein
MIHQISGATRTAARVPLCSGARRRGSGTEVEPPTGRATLGVALVRIGVVIWAPRITAALPTAWLTSCINN